MQVATHLDIRPAIFANRETLADKLCNLPSGNHAAWNPVHAVQTMPTTLHYMPLSKIGQDSSDPCATTAARSARGATSGVNLCLQ
jgi:hypothetical protein